MTRRDDEPSLKSLLAVQDAASLDELDHEESGPHRSPSMRLAEAPKGQQNSVGKPRPVYRQRALATESRAASIHRSIGRAVIEQRLLPGTRLPEDQIGGLFGASRTLVRSALQRLAHDGIVTISRNRGAFVASPTIEDARHVFEARRIVEGVVVGRAATSIGSGDIDALDDVLARGRQAVAAGDRGTAIRLSGEFHLGIGACANQPILQGFLVELVSRSSLVIALYGRGYSSACADDEHRNLLEALRRHDGTSASRLMAAHLDHIEADLDLEPRPLRTVSLAEVLADDDNAVA